MKLVAANWKLNPATLSEAKTLVAGYRLPASGATETVILPPFVFLEELAHEFPQLVWGAQDFYFKDTGSFTGEVSLPMIKSVGAKYVLVGHSDRRIKFNETDEMVNQKLLAALGEGFNVILAVGETEKGSESQIVESLNACTNGVSSDQLSRLAIAYEPVWAISTTPGAEADTPEHANEVIGRLRQVLNAKYLYGGSVNTENAESFLSQTNIEGALIGGASLKPEEFSKILALTAD